jgi:hypothetical protein
MPQKTKGSQEPPATKTQSLDHSQTDADVSTSHESPYSWPPIYEIPDRPPQVILVFHGLMGLAYNTLGFCEIGMHSNAPGHECTVKVSELLDFPSRPFFTYNFGLLANGGAPDRIRLDIVEPLPDYTPPKFFMNKDSDHDENDFRRVVDYESEDFYGRKLKLKTSVFKPRLNIRSGVFLTGLVTEDRYYRVAPNDARYLGHVAVVVAAFIYHKPEGYVALRIDKQELKLTPREDRIYMVEFENLCPDDVPDGDTATATDFDLYADTFEIPDDREHYRLVKEGPYLQQKFDPVLLKKEEPTTEESRERTRGVRWLEVFHQLFSSRESPCGEAGFGKTTGGLSGS